MGQCSYIYSLDHRAFFGTENPQLKAFEKLQEDYSKTDAVVIALAPTTGSVFTAEFLGILKNLTEASWKIPYSQRVESLTNFQHVTVEGDDISTQDLVVSPQSLTASEIKDIQQAALNEPFLIDSLVNPEGNVAGVRITLNMPAKDPFVEIPLLQINRTVICSTHVIKPLMFKAMVINNTPPIVRRRTKISALW